MATSAGLYQWLVRRYPNTLCSVVDHHSPFPQLDITKPNPNGVEFDNLFIHINGAIHTCFHPPALPAPQSYDDICKFILEYIERVISIVRPRKLLYIALDGVAPLAKMNHERIRCFKAAREAAWKSARTKFSKVEGDKLDSNVITPGTEFMDLLSRALKYFVYTRMNTDPGWRGIKVILSDSTVLGEGADKIMSYIKSQRNFPGYNPNTRHCLYGMDADLIIRALATHEIHISILREVIPSWKNYRKELLYSECMRELMTDLIFEFFNIWVLREYLEGDLLPNVDGTDFDRLINDFVFMYAFVGNGFLPHLPSLDVSKGGIELLMAVYQQEFVKMGYLTNAPEVNLKSMEHFLQALSSHEHHILIKRDQLDMEKKNRKRRETQDSHDQLKNVEHDIIRESSSNPEDVVESTINKVKIHDGFLELKHYTINFGCESHDVERIRRHAVLKYTEGVCWIMQYYYRQVPSWQWFYPYHYAPLASAFRGLDKLDINFTLGHPLKAIDHLLAILPAVSAQALPLFYRELMTNESSPIVDFYPKDAKFDRDGKRHPWQGICKLPFIDESRLLTEVMKVEHTLTDEEKQRNRFGKDMLYVHSSHPLAEMIKDLPSSDPSSDVEIPIRPDLSDGMNGNLCISDKPVCPTDIPSPFVDKPAVKMNSVKSVDYKCPSHAHVPKLPCGIKLPPRILRSQDMPCPPAVSDAIPTPTVFQSQSPTKKGKQDDVSCKLGGSKDEGEKQNAINGKSEGELVVVGSQNKWTAEKSTNQAEAGNGGMSDGMRTEDEKLINVGVSEKAFTGGNEEHQSPSGGPKRKKKNKKKKTTTQQQLDAQQEVQSDKHGAKGEVQQGINVTVNNARGRLEDLAVGQMKDKNMNGYQVSEGETNTKKRKKVNKNDKSKASHVSTEHSERRKRQKSKSKNVEIEGISLSAEEQEADR